MVQFIAVYPIAEPKYSELLPIACKSWPRIEQDYELVHNIWKVPVDTSSKHALGCRHAHMTLLNLIHIMTLTQHGGTWNLVGTAFTSYFLRKVTGMAFLTVSAFV